MKAINSYCWVNGLNWMFENMGVNVLTTVLVNSFNESPACFTIISFFAVRIRTNNTKREIMLVFFAGFIFYIELST